MGFHIFTARQIICKYIQIKPCRDDPLLVKSGTKVSIKYLACLSARPSVSWEFFGYPLLGFAPSLGSVANHRSGVGQNFNAQNSLLEFVNSLFSVRGNLW